MKKSMVLTFCSECGRGQSFIINYSLFTGKTICELYKLPCLYCKKKTKHVFDKIKEVG